MIAINNKKCLSKEGFNLNFVEIYLRRRILVRKVYKFFLDKLP